jgi:hypothetical protein
MSVAGSSPGEVVPAPSTAMVERSPRATPVPTLLRPIVLTCCLVTLVGRCRAGSRWGAHAPPHQLGTPAIAVTFGPSVMNPGVWQSARAGAAAWHRRLGVTGAAFVSASAEILGRRRGEVADLPRQSRLRRGQLRRQRASDGSLPNYPMPPQLSSAADHPPALPGRRPTARRSCPQAGCLGEGALARYSATRSRRPPLRPRCARYSHRA